MRAVIVESPGAGVVAGEFPEPEPNDSEQVFDLVGAGVHWLARSVAAGLHYGSGDSYPLVPGVDAVARAADGHLVYTGWTRDPWGTMAERIAAPIGFPLPGGDPLAAAAGMNPGMSGWIPLTLHRQKHGELGRVLVLGATGMSGRMAVQSALHLGATTVFGAGRDRAQLAHLGDLGATPINLTDNPADVISGALVGEAPDLILDYVWGPVAEAAFAALGRRGTGDDRASISYVQIGSLAGSEALLPSSLLRSRRIAVTGSGLGSTPRAVMMAELPKVLALICDGTLEVAYRAYPIEDVAAAWADTSSAHRAVIVP